MPLPFVAVLTILALKQCKCESSGALQAQSAAAAASPAVSHLDSLLQTLGEQHGALQQMQENAPPLPLQCQHLGLWVQNNQLTEQALVISGQHNQNHPV